MFSDLSVEFEALKTEVENITYIKHLDDLKEPLLNTDNQQFTTYPIIYKDIWEIYKKQVRAIWTPEEIDFTDGTDNWDKLSDDVKWFIKHILAFFASSDAIVNLNITKNFVNDVTINEAQVCYRFQAMMEDVHSETYSLLIDTYIKDKAEKENLLNAVKTMPCVFNKMKWALNWLKDSDKYATRLVAFAIVEGIFFSGSFCAIYWLKKNNNPLKGLTQANEFIARDEGVHTEFACLLYSKLISKLSETDVHNMIKDAVIIEEEFICESLPCKMIDMDSDKMKQYIKFIANRLAKQLGYNIIYKDISNPFIWMEMMSIDNKSNFFENRPTEYQKSNLVNTDITFVEDF
jgi:ribonucleotide reductase beta subunit family protein with ferritin-like domain